MVGVGVMVMACMLSPLQTALLLSSAGPSDEIATLTQVLSWIPVIAAVTIGLWLIRKRHALAARWFDDSESAIDFDPRTLLRLGLLVIGVALIARGIPALISGVTNGVQTWMNGSDTSYAVHTSWAWTTALTSSAGPVVELVVGASLLASSTRLADRLWGTESGEPTDHPDDASA